MSKDKEGENDIIVTGDQLADIMEGKAHPRDFQNKPLGIEELGDPGGDFGAALGNLNGHSNVTVNRLIQERDEKVKKLLEGYTVKKPLFYESMTAACAKNGAKVRIWRTSAELPEYNEIEIQLLLGKIPATASMQQVIDILSTIEGIAACELTDPDGNGAVAYFEW